MYHFPLTSLNIVELGEVVQMGRGSTWYTSLMPKHLPERELQAAEAAVAYAQQVRSFHRRRTDKTSKQRVTDINLAIERLKKAMKPLKAMMGGFPYGPQTPQAEMNRQTIREA